MSLADLAAKVGLSAVALLRRVRMLERAGGHRALRRGARSARRFGLPVSVFFSVKL